ncbi:xanthine dehydrogenase family protein molybdopterin-binding subunit [Novosphingobium guangzhouense]|uniref:xanthine dehydrogenase family protein molybdopterin-binding subunit n=1 Tax=Novosphingobium guangzhouense TaxID=1850347 RepID=UPI001473AB47|nr:molybdopterin cofactor-binding domain-containing protein [Novosphingobium guangzhouense]
MGPTPGVTLNRRGFLVLASSGLLLGVAGTGAGRGLSSPAAPDGLVQRFLSIDWEGTVTVFAKHLDMGQGIWSGLASIVAEELDADWSRVRVVGAPARVADYAHNAFREQTTGGSTSTANSWDELRRAGATARAMLVRAAAQAWQVPEALVRTRNGRLIAPGHAAGYGDFAAAAGRLPVPVDVPLKSRADWRLLGIGAEALPRTDTGAKTRGATVYGIDGTWPDMRHAVIARCPRIGGRLRGYDGTAARAMPGVDMVVEVPSGVAVIARTTWHAIRAREALRIDWDMRSAETRSDSAIAADFARAMEEGAPAYADTRGDPDTAFARAHRVVEARFRFPYLAHAPMEPPCISGRMVGGVCEVRAGFQSQTRNQQAIADILGLPLDRVLLDTVPAGGSFGRRASFDSDWVAEFAHVLKASRWRWPIKLTRTREDDVTGGYYRPLMIHAMRAGLDRKGRLIAFDQRMAGQSVTPNAPDVPNWRDWTVLEGVFHELYACPASRLRWWKTPARVPVLTYRSISNNHTGIAKEIFVDRLARAAGADPVAYRLALLEHEPRQAAVLRLAAEKAGWSDPPPPGVTRAVAVHRSEGSFIAQVAQLSGTAQDFRIERMVTAIDCGLALNPDTVRAQVEGGTGFGLSAGLYGRVTLDGGAAQDANFDTYRVLRMNEMPRVMETHFIDGADRPSGVGEPGSVPGTAAVVNALERMGLPPVESFPVFAPMPDQA